MKVQEKTEFIHDKLMAPQEETKQFVNFMHYLDSCSEKLEDLKKELEYAYHVLRLMKTHDVAVMDDIKDLYLDVEEMLVETENKLQEKNDSKPLIVEKLAKSLEKDIQKIFDDVDYVGKEIVKPLFLDVSLDPPVVADSCIHV